MQNIFEHISSNWVRYNEYEWRKADDGNLYLIPASGAIPEFYDPMAVVNDMVLEAAAIGRHLMHGTPEAKCRDKIHDFALKYGLLGIITALPTTANFYRYEKVYFPRNNILRDETMDTLEYIRLFFPFRMPNIRKKGVESTWSSHEDDDVYMKSFFLISRQRDPEAMFMSFTRDYGERYDWMASVFKDWAFTLLGSRLYYHDKDKNPDARRLYENGMSIFENNAPTYHLELRERPTLVWDFHSLQMNIKMMLALMMTDDQNPIKLCLQCMMPFIAETPEQEFCSPEHEKKYKREHHNKK